LSGIPKGGGPGAQQSSTTIVVGGEREEKSKPIVKSTNGTKIWRRGKGWATSIMLSAQRAEQGGGARRPQRPLRDTMSHAVHKSLVEPNRNRNTFFFGGVGGGFGRGGFGGGGGCFCGGFCWGGEAEKIHLGKGVTEARPKETSGETWSPSAGDLRPLERTTGERRAMVARIPARKNGEGGEESLRKDEKKRVNGSTENMETSRKTFGIQGKVWQGGGGELVTKRGF